jgi:hypothetical protein
VRAVATNGWQNYVSGVMKSGCGGVNDVDHCVQVVGYNNQATDPYWIVRNSVSAPCCVRV